jgi:hypothetical protein
VLGLPSADEATVLHTLDAYQALIGDRA